MFSKHASNQLPIETFMRGSLRSEGDEPSQRILTAQGEAVEGQVRSGCNFNIQNIFLPIPNFQHTDTCY